MATSRYDKSNHSSMVRIIVGVMLNYSHSPVALNAVFSIIAQSVISLCHSCNRHLYTISHLYISLWHNDHCHPSFIHCPSCKTQRFTFFQTFCHHPYIDKFPVCLLKWLCNHLPYKFFLMRFEKHIPFLIWLHIS